MESKRFSRFITTSVRSKPQECETKPRTCQPHGPTLKNTRSSNTTTRAIDLACILRFQKSFRMEQKKREDEKMLFIAERTITSSYYDCQPPCCAALICRGKSFWNLFCLLPIASVTFSLGSGRLKFHWSTFTTAPCNPPIMTLYFCYETSSRIVDNAISTHSVSCRLYLLSLEENGGIVCT